MTAQLSHCCSFCYFSWEQNYGISVIQGSHFGCFYLFSLLYKSNQIRSRSLAWSYIAKYCNILFHLVKVCSTIPGQQVQQQKMDCQLIREAHILHSASDGMQTYSFLREFLPFQFFPSALFSYPEHKNRVTVLQKRRIQGQYSGHKWPTQKMSALTFVDSICFWMCRVQIHQVLTLSTWGLNRYAIWLFLLHMRVSKLQLFLRRRTNALCPKPIHFPFKAVFISRHLYASYQ